jgi:hypothetical protein
MAAGGKGWVERARRGVKTAWFMVAMVASLLMASAPALVAAGDVAVALWLEVRLGCLRCHGLRGHLERYGFRSSLVDIPLVSIARSVVITCKQRLAPPHCCSNALAGYWGICSYELDFFSSSENFCIGYVCYFFKYSNFIIFWDMGFPSRFFIFFPFRMGICPSESYSSCYVRACLHS